MDRPGEAPLVLLVTSGKGPFLLGQICRPCWEGPGSCLSLFLACSERGTGRFGKTSQSQSCLQPTAATAGLLFCLRVASTVAWGARCTRHPEEGPWGGPLGSLHSRGAPRSTWVYLEKGSPFLRWTKAPDGLWQLASSHFPFAIRRVEWLLKIYVMQQLLPILYLLPLKRKVKIKFPRGKQKCVVIQGWSWDLCRPAVCPCLPFWGLTQEACSDRK